MAGQIRGVRCLATDNAALIRPTRRDVGWKSEAHSTICGVSGPRIHQIEAALDHLDVARHAIDPAGD